MGANGTTFDYDGLSHRAASSWVAMLGLLWGFAEATVFFIVPDVLLGAVALFAPRAAPRVLAFTLAGALAGGALTYGVSSELDPSRSEAVLERVPTVCLFVRPENAPAIRVYEAVGMRREGAYRSLIF